MSTFVGIDPGTTGCVSVLDDSKNIAFHDTPTNQVKVGKKARAVYDQPEMMKILSTITAEASSDLMVVLEEVHAMPKTGSQGNFSSGFGFGLWQGMLTALKIPFITVQPSKWKKALGIKKLEESDSDSAKKNQDRMFARQLYPAAADEMSLVKHHGRADALLLAEYGRRTVSLAPEDKKVA